MQEKQSNAELFKVTHRDEKSGLVSHSTPYVLRISGSGEGRSRLLEKPKGSGNIFDMKGNAKGRWIVDPKTGKGKHDPNAAHVAYIPPETEDQKLARSLVEKDSRIAQLEKELASIAKEKENKSKGV